MPSSGNARNSSTVINDVAAVLVIIRSLQNTRTSMSYVLNWLIVTRSADSIPDVNAAIDVKPDLKRRLAPVHPRYLCGPSVPLWRPSAERVDPAHDPSQKR